ncbi:MAG: hypothetical protein HRT57_14845 [Crocinitomicaceae bacterium]|nr:hypothetical protein [Crocinitomicaceae bacterium]
MDYYVNNRPSGAFERYYRNGVLRERGTFNRSRYFGMHEKFYESGCREYMNHYNIEGREDSVFTYYHDNCDTSITNSGQIEFIYNTLDGFPVDTAYRFYRNGDLNDKITYGADGRVLKKQMLSKDKP